MRVQLTFIFLCVCLTVVLAQDDIQLSNLKEKKIRIDTTSFRLDSLLVVPGSVELLAYDDKSGVASSFYSLINNSTLVVDKSLTSNEYLIRYRVFPEDMTQSKRGLDSTLLTRQFEGRLLGYEYSPAQGTEKLFGPGMIYSGSFSRGLSVGNSQDLVLNSNFNIQLAGDLGSDIELLAAITDNNIPIQPEGSTQQLQEFDQVFIELRKNDTRLIAGDFEISRPGSYFLNYFKKLQGVKATSKVGMGRGRRLEVASGVAISRGKFARHSIPQQEGNQGPYKLQGSNGESFIIVLAGTERVYLDGILLERGKERDYIIDYNRAEVTFTANRLITKDSRLIVEFEYAIQQYRRSLITTNLDYYTPRGHYYAHIYSEQDSKNTGTNQALSKNELELLSRVGDDLDNLLSDGIDTVSGFRETDRILYIRKDTLIRIRGIDTLISYYSYLPNSAEANLEVSFVDRGPGQGTYILSESTSANGRVFEWVGLDPLTGDPLGRYEPGAPLAAPASKQVFAFGMEQMLTDHLSLHQELAISRNDLNRFSNINDADNLGFSNRTEIQYNSQLKTSSQGPAWNARLAYEYLGQRMSLLNPYRNAEFDRDWNITGQDPQNEHIIQMEAGYNNPKNGEVITRVDFFKRGQEYQGLRPEMSVDWLPGSWQLKGQVNYLSSTTQLSSSEFFRPKFDLSHRIGALNNWKVGVFFDHENNRIFDTQSERLLANSLRYDQTRFYLQSPESDDLSTSFYFQDRTDFRGDSLHLKKVTHAKDISWRGKWTRGPMSRLIWQLTWRKLDIVRDELFQGQDNNTYLGRIDYSFQAIDGFLRGTAVYELGSGQEAKITHNFLEVEPGLGTHTWIDRNQDSIQQADEFEIAVFSDQANYIRVNLISNEFIPTNNTSLNYTMRIEPKAIWNDKLSGNKLLRKLSSLTSINVSEKSINSSGLAISPFSYSLQDTALISSTGIIRNTLFFNRFDPNYSVQLTSIIQENKSSTTSGNESKQTRQLNLRGQWRFVDNISSEISLQRKRTENNNTLFESRRFDIDSYHAEAGFIYQKSTSLRARFAYSFIEKVNNMGATELLKEHIISGECTWNRADNSSIRLGLEWISADFSGNINTPVAFQMLEGLQQGKNILWEALFEKRLLTNIRLNISYEGRRIGKGQVVHVGRARVSAIF